ncbi:maturation protein [ssRNA phage Zoerhiza.4_22]|uniref:Maturation protein n=2 Tax=Leviviricetes TaxID=2842243 RepID=A0A8S5L382_9VIRU|nr:maturation protein [ssRNA phage Zoerhiza.4_22]QDH86763.1 MAG: hypothetical protein H4Rhizo45395_000004 [Leviviridae sp.]DAD51876.1 TPA_asm: maturation protein [ssRNA phage Zoerhiza.4_22]
MASRHRTKVLTATSPGRWDLMNPPLFGPGYVIPYASGAAGVTRFKVCDDVVSSPPFTALNPLSIVEYSCEPLMRITGIVQEGSWQNVFSRYNPTNRSLYQYAPTLTPVNWLYWSTKALANLNPSKPKVDLPLFLFEFKDFPEMLKNLGDVLSRRIHPKSIPEGYLSYSFGWAPLVNDLFTLFNLAKSIDDRRRYLRSLERGTRVRRKLGKLVVQHSITPNGYSVGSTYPGGQTVFQADIDYTEKLEVWFTAHVKLRDKLPAGTDIQYLSKKLVLGLRASPATFWNMVPWTWLIDYMFNFGDLMEATLGSIPYHVPDMCIMAKSVATSKLTNTRLLSGLLVEGPCTLTTTGKQRYVTYEPIPWLTFEPILTLGQMANLGGLVVARSLGSKGFSGAH